MMEPMASQVVLLSVFKLKHILGFNIMHHTDSWGGSAFPENMDRWAVSQGSSISLSDTTTALLPWGGWIPAWLGKVTKEKTFKHETCKKMCFQVSSNGWSILTWTKTWRAEFFLLVQCFWAHWLGGMIGPNSPLQRGQTPPVTLQPL